MATLRDQLQSRLQEIDARIMRLKKGCEEEVAKLEVQKSKLLKGADALTPDLEKIVEGLRKEGFLGGSD